ncbi:MULTISPECIES: hypothetical protein [Nonomuraea]|uniref:Uncharacterized protein n=1 Tax=Nonomuraea mangrovi TaxID=2316207 RepID=A0ABW4T0S5_9ACTN
MTNAGYFARNVRTIEVLLDRDAVTSEAAAGGEAWQKGNLQRMSMSIPLTDEERAAVDDGQAALDQLLDRLADVPTPSGPTPRQLAIPPGTALLPIITIT